MRNEHKAIFAANLRVAMREAGITQDRLAKDLDTSYHTINAWCRGLTEPGAMNLLAIAKRFDKPGE